MFYRKTNSKQPPLRFNIIDSPMGIGKSATLIDLIRFHNRGEDREPTRFIVFVPTIRERDCRYARELNLKCPETPPYNKSILELIRNGDNIVTTHALWGIFNDETLSIYITRAESLVLPLAFQHRKLFSDIWEQIRYGTYNSIWYVLNYGWHYLVLLAS